MNNKEYMKEYMRMYSANKRTKAIEILGGKCVKCESVDGLHVHHRNPEEKSFTLGSRWHRAWEEIEKELEKCELLCEYHHIEHHKSNHPHGDVKRYWRGCRCDECKAAMSEHNRNYNNSRVK